MATQGTPPYAAGTQLAAAGAAAPMRTHNTTPRCRCYCCACACLQGCPAQAAAAARNGPCRHRSDMQRTSQPGTLRAWVLLLPAQNHAQKGTPGAPCNPHWGCCCYCCGHAGGCGHRAGECCLQGAHSCHCPPRFTTRHNHASRACAQPGGWHRPAMSALSGHAQPQNMRQAEQHSTHPHRQATPPTQAAPLQLKTTHFQGRVGPLRRWRAGWRRR
jgi:hypothetical protein